MDKQFVKLVCISAVLLAVIMLALPAAAWEPNGKIYGTDVEYSEASVTKQGMSLKLRNSFPTAVKLSFRVDFFDARGNRLGYSLFGLKEIPGGGEIEVNGNHITGKWKPCRDAARAIWEKMTYEPVYR